MKLTRNRLPAEIPTASMADVAFLLIIFFMLTAVFSSTKGLEFVLPKDDPNDLNVKAEESTLVVVQGYNDYVVDRRPARLEELGGYIQEKVKQNPKKPVIIQTSGEVPYGATIDVLDLCRQLGVVNVAIPTQEEVQRWGMISGR